MDLCRCVRSSILRAKGHLSRRPGPTSSEALALFFETADPSEVARRYRGDVLVTQVEVPVG